MPNILREMSQVVPTGDILLEHWNKEISAISSALGDKMDYNRQITTAVLLENASKQIARFNKLNESTQTADVSYFKKYAINLLSAAVPNLIATDIVSVQPLSSRVGEVRHLKVSYGSNKGAVKKGDQMFGVFQAGNGNTNYSADFIEDEVLTSVDTEASLSWGPVIPGSVVLVNQAKTYTDTKKAGELADKDSGSKVGTIDYATGKITFESTQSSADITASYNYDNMTSPVQAPEVNLSIHSLPMIAKSRKLKALYSLDSAFDLQSEFGMQMNNELVAYTASEIKHEIDGEIMNDLLRVASAASTSFNATPAEGISLRDHNEGFYNTVIEGSNNIFQATRLATASFIIAGVGACNIIESLPRFKPSGIANPVGPHLAGWLSDKPVYKNPFYPSDSYVLGYRGQGLFDAGYIYAPYMPIMSTQLIMDANFQGQKGFATSYAKKTVNSDMYSKGTINR